MTRVKNSKGPMPLVLIEISGGHKSTYDMKHCCGLSISTDPLKTKTETTQRHRCQKFGHVQKNCNFNFRCMRYGEEQLIYECTEPRTTAAKCANCETEHLSIPRNCSENPNYKWYQKNYSWKSEHLENKYRKSKTTTKIAACIQNQRIEQERIISL